MAPINTCAPGAIVTTERNPWILGSFPKDFSALLLPALLGFYLSRGLNRSLDGWSGQLVLFLVYGWIDSGHVWTTFWRTHIYKRERFLRRRALWLPALVTGGIALWLLLGLPGFWTFAVVATLFHNQRQLWGFVRWYEKLAGKRRKETFWFFHLLIFLPVLAYVLRPVDPGHYYLVKADIPHFSWAGAFQWVTWAWLATCIYWAAFELRLFFRGEREWGRVFGLSSAAVIYGYGFFAARSVMDVAFPLVLSHGVSYLAVMAQTSRRLGIPAAGGRKGWVWLAATALAGGVVAHFLLEELDFEAWNQGGGAWIICVGVALYFGPTLTHYLFDSWLWTGRHPEAGEIFRSHEA